MNEIKRDKSLKYRRFTFSVTEDEVKMFKKEVMKIRCTHQELFEKMFYFYFNNIKAKVDLDDSE